jgi:cytochrome c556
MSRKRLVVWSALALALVVAMSAVAMTGAEAIKARQETMESVRDGMMALSAIAKKEQPFDVEVVKANAAKIAENLTTSAELFPESSAEGEVETWAKAEIWTEWEQFDEILKSTIQAAVDMQSVEDAEAFMPALGAIGNGCKSCHDSYRRPKN